jgi:hypothetical protein
MSCKTGLCVDTVRALCMVLSLCAPVIQLGCDKFLKLCDFDRLIYICLRLKPHAVQCLAAAALLHVFVLGMTCCKSEQVVCCKLGSQVWAVPAVMTAHVLFVCIEPGSQVPK